MIKVSLGCLGEEEFAAVREKWLPLLKNPELLQAGAIPSRP